MVSCRAMILFYLILTVCSNRLEGTDRGHIYRENKQGKKNLVCPETMEQNDENALHSSVNLNYDTLEHIFQYLNGRDLENAAMVCRSWSEPANKEKSRRDHPCHCFIKPHDEINSILSYIENIRIIPMAGFFFIPLLFDRDSVEDYVQNVLHEHCEIIILYCFGLDTDVPFVRDMTCAFLPQVPNVKIETYKVTEPFMEMWDIINVNVTREISKSNHEASTCFKMMIFCNYSYNSFTLTENFISFVKERKTCMLSSVSAIMLDDIYVPYKTSRIMHQGFGFETNCIALVITGPTETWSVNLEKQCKTQEHIEAKLQLFKDEVKLKKHSLGFMFSHTIRTRNLYREMAMTIFKRLFPEISPLVGGCFAFHLEHSNYEKTIDEVNEEKNDKDDHKREILHTDFYITFLILTYG